MKHKQILYRPHKKETQSWESTLSRLIVPRVAPTTRNFFGLCGSAG